jgi:hypothetical protein
MQQTDLLHEQDGGGPVVVELAVGNLVLGR